MRFPGNIALVIGTASGSINKRCFVAAGRISRRHTLVIAANSKAMPENGPVEPRKETRQ